VFRLLTAWVTRVATVKAGNPFGPFQRDRNDPASAERSGAVADRATAALAAAHRNRMLGHPPPAARIVGTGRTSQPAGEDCEERRRVLRQRVEKDDQRRSAALLVSRTTMIAPALIRAIAGMFAPAGAETA
jgi:hypothetical protein